MGILDFPYSRLPGSAGSFVRRGVLAVAILVVALVAGCAGEGTRRSVQSTPSTTVADQGATSTSAAGVEHVVRRGQTLWRISKVYGVEIDELASANGISDTSSLKTGQVLFIPGASEVRDVPAYPAPLDAATAIVPPGTVEDDGNSRWLWPVKNGEVLSYFGAPRRTHRHQGIDIRGRGGQPVRATRPGRVTYSGSGMRGYGKTVIVDHGNGMSSLYAHNSRLLVRKGQRVERGEMIAEVGRSGNASTEHCHFEIRRRDKPVDPLGYLKPTREAHR
jgi:murein DD-endopeptidase MepM/ murein hydrolase activator NlpD